MSERFVRGWKVSLTKLQGLVGSSRVSVAEILESAANANCLEDVLMTLGDGDQDEGRDIAESALTEILEGELTPRHSTRYARVTELVLNHAALPLANEYEEDLSEPVDQIVLRLTYAVPNESHGRWNPLLEGCGLPKLADAWAAPSFDFPWGGSGGPAKGDWPWPVWTTFEPSALVALGEELAAITKQNLEALPAEVLADDEAWVGESRDELWQGLTRLRTWLESARSAEDAEGLAWATRGNALVLVMDGDQ